jgi:hypothetical protein
MIDSVALAWGGSIGTAERRTNAPRAGRRAEPVSPPVHLDMRGLHERLAGDDGQLTVKRYGHDETPYVAGHWQSGSIDVLYREGRLELRASLPKLLTGRNDVVLDERGVHDGLRELVRAGAELVQHPLELREAVPTRLDYAYQWQVPSVAFVLEHVKAAFAPARKLRTEHVSAKGGRSLVWGYGSRRVIRFYDKVGELAAHGEESEHELDTLLRYEIQERRRPKLRLVHEQGYRADVVRRELAQGVQVLGASALHDVEALLDSYGDWPHAFAHVMAALHLAEHDEFWPLVRTRLCRNAYFAWKKRAREAALAVGDWQPIIPLNAFDAGSDLWLTREQEAA